MIISFASGKGGTGKTTIATNFALILSQELKTQTTKIQFLDCDVEEPNAAIFLNPKITSSTSVGIPIPKVDLKKCNYCSKCAEVCAYNAIAVLKAVNHTKGKTQGKANNTSNNSNDAKNNVLIFPELCHGCGGCIRLCPENALSETEREIGYIETGRAGSIEFIQGRLNIGEPMATPLIREMKKTGLKDKEKRRNGENGQLLFNHLTIIDVPPGTSCPVIEAVKNSDFTVLVTEPTPFGLHDLTLAVETLRKLKIPCGVVINRDGVGDNKTEKFCHDENIPVLMRIPIDRDIAVAYSKGIPMIKIDHKYKMKFLELYKKIMRTQR